MKVGCVRCGQPPPLHGRKLCRRCYYRAGRDGTLVDFPRATRGGADLMADYRLLRSEGHDDRQVAERLGMKLAALRRAVQRARRREDAA